MAKSPNRRLILIAGCVSLLITASFYCWSVFSRPMALEYGWDYATISLGFSLQQLVVFPTQIIIGKLLTDNVKPIKTFLLGALCMGSGWILAGFSMAPITVLISFVIVAGIGNGALYITAMSLVNRWYPDKRGFATGLVVGAAGIANLLWAPLGNSFIETFDPSTALKIMGCIIIVVLVSVAWMIKNPPVGYVPEGWTQPDEKKATGKTTKEMLRDPLFYLLVIVFALCASAGQMVMGHGSAIFQDLGGFDAAMAAVMVGVLAVANCLGRFSMGALSDKIGRLMPLMAIIVVDAIMCFIASRVTGVVVIVALIIVTFCFGSCNVLMNTLTADTFGPKHFNTNWTTMYVGYVIATLLGPNIASLCLATPGGFQTGFLVSACLEIVALVVFIVATRVISRRKAKAKCSDSEAELDLAV